MSEIMDRASYLSVRPMREIMVSGHKIRIWRDAKIRDTAYEYVEIPEGASIGPHYHSKSKEEVLVVQGSGTFTLDGRSMPYKQTKTFRIPSGVRHGIKAKEYTMLLSMQTPQIIDWKTGEMDIHE